MGLRGSQLSHTRSFWKISTCHLSNRGQSAGWIPSLSQILALTLSIVAKLLAPSVSVYLCGLLWILMASSTLPLNKLPKFVVSSKSRLLTSSSFSTPLLSRHMVAKRRSEVCLLHRLNHALIVMQSIVSIRHQDVHVPCFYMFWQYLQTFVLGVSQRSPSQTIVLVIVDSLTYLCHRLLTSCDDETILCVILLSMVIIFTMVMLTISSLSSLTSLICHQCTNKIASCRHYCHFLPD